MFDVVDVIVVMYVTDEMDAIGVYIYIYPDLAIYKLY